MTADRLLAVLGLLFVIGWLSFAPWDRLRRRRVRAAAEAEARRLGLTVERIRLERRWLTKYFLARGQSPQAQWVVEPARPQHWPPGAEAMACCDTYLAVAQGTLQPQAKVALGEIADWGMRDWAGIRGEPAGITVVSNEFDTPDSVRELHHLLTAALQGGA